ncbi:MAG: FlgD immunoglobulin-like domain containing protein [Elusimicrobiota bacterium]
MISMRFKFFFFLSFFSLVSISIQATPNFSSSQTILLSSALPQVVDISTSPKRLYFIRDNFQIKSATSTDGVTWGERAVPNVSTATLPLLGVSTFTGCTLLPLAGGGYRMLYSAFTSSSTWAIFSATSSDGLSWGNEVGERIAGSTAYLGSPRLNLLSNGNWRLYYIKDMNTGNDLTDRTIYTSLSSDEGATWGAVSIVHSQNAIELALSTRTDQRVRLFYTQPLTSETTASVVVSALSTDSNGTSFSSESNTRFSTSSLTGSLESLVVFRDTETFRYRALFGFRIITSTNTHMYTAMTSSPDAQGLSPSSVVRTDPSGSFTISGEIFASTPTVVLSKSGQTDITGTSVVRNSDQSLTATFDTNSKELGNWNLVLTNPDGKSSTVSNALTITFLPGQVSFLDNLLRLKNVSQTTITVQIFEAGQVRLSLFTLDGKLINTIFEGDAPIGTTNYTWDGKTAQGNTVASGTYLLEIVGPKLNKVEKIVVVR